MSGKHPHRFAGVAPGAVILLAAADSSPVGLTWHLDQLAHKGVSALQVNYAHSDKWGRSYGQTCASDPRRK
jgi:hypothetical protein